MARAQELEEGSARWDSEASLSRILIKRQKYFKTLPVLQTKTSEAQAGASLYLPPILIGKLICEGTEVIAELVIQTEILSLAHVALAMVNDFPEIQGGGSLILAWQIKNKNVLVVGGGEVAAGRIINLLNADAKVHVVCPRQGLNDEVAYRVAQGQVNHIDRIFLPIDLEPEKNIAMVLTAVDDPEASTRIWKYCKKLKIPANIADVPPECDFYFGSVHRDGPLQIMVSTNGNGPRLAASIRRQIGEMLPKGTGDSIRKVGQLRRKLRRIAPGKSTADISKRMSWMSEVCDKWTTEEFNAMDEQDMEELVQYYESGKVPAFDTIRLKPRDDVVWEFDGSLGWM